MLSNDIITTDEQETANLFSNYFSSVHTTDPIDVDVSKLGIPNFYFPSKVVYTVDDVFHTLLSLYDMWSVGPKGSFLFELRSILAYLLWILFMRSLDEGISPSMLKLSSVTSVSKNGSPSDVSNYQPMSIQFHIS